MEELSKLSHRGYTTGFLFGEPRNVGQEYHSAYIRSHEFVGRVEELRGEGSVVIGVRNRIRIGDDLELIGPGMRSNTLHVGQLLLLDEQGETSEVAAVNPNQRIMLHVPFTVDRFDLLRREKITPA
jgi:putative protease